MILDSGAFPGRAGYRGPPTLSLLVAQITQKSGSKETWVMQSMAQGHLEELKTNLMDLRVFGYHSLCPTRRTGLAKVGGRQCQQHWTKSYGARAVPTASAHLTRVGTLRTESASPECLGGSPTPSQTCWIRARRPTEFSQTSQAQGPPPSPACLSQHKQTQGASRIPSVTVHWAKRGNCTRRAHC